jgi:hypothetical protein
MEFLANDFQAAKAVPNHILARLPNIKTPVSIFVKTVQLPPTRTLPNPSLKLLFSKLLPSHKQPDPLTIHVPLAQFIEQVHMDAAKAWAAGARSLVGFHPSLRIPFWFITLFELVHTLQKGKAGWTAVTRLLTTTLPLMAKTSHQQKVLEGLKGMMSVMGWNTRLGQLCTSLELLPLFHAKMINDRLINSISNLVSNNISSHAACQGVRLLNLDFQTSLGYGDTLGVPPLLL